MDRLVDPVSAAGIPPDTLEPAPAPDDDNDDGAAAAAVTDVGWCWSISNRLSGQSMSPAAL